MSEEVKCHQAKPVGEESRYSTDPSNHHGRCKYGVGSQHKATWGGWNQLKGTSAQSAWVAYLNRVEESKEEIRDGKIGFAAFLS